MAWRIDEAVTRGEIDNTVEGRTIGRVWLAGRDEPLELSLMGDCWRDLAGAKLRFTNKHARPRADLAEIQTCQAGIVGDMTASRKVKAPIDGDWEIEDLYQNQEDIPFEWRNTLYLEWFSESNGRVVIESAEYQLALSPYQWQMDEDDEEAQKLANLQAMRDFMALVIRRRGPHRAAESHDGELNEYQWEERLKESDRLTDAYQEVMEKYMADADSERKEAFVMGWDGLLEELAERDEGDCGMDYPSHDEASFDHEQEAEGFELLDEDDLRERDSHPLQARAQELALRAMDVVTGDGGPGTVAYHLVSNLLQVSGKLAGALNDDGCDEGLEKGYVLAVLKRCLNWLNEAIAHCQQLMATENDPDQLAALAHLRSSAFEIRDAITELRRKLK
jgi:hypothetical protein